MLVLFETPAGFALFKVLDEGKLDKVEDLWKEFETGESARKIVKLKAFSKFENTAEALGAATLLVDSKPSKSLRKFLKAECQGDILAVADSKLGNTIKEKLQIDCIHNNAVMEVMRGLRSQLSELISGLAGQDLGPMSLGLSHSLSRYKLKFSPDKVDTMIIQAIGLLDDLDKELNTYAMRVREWYGWHFPELGKIVQDNIVYAKVVKAMGHRTNAQNMDFSGILPEDVEAEFKEAANISMGTDVSDQDMMNIKALCDQVISLAEYRAQLSEYLRSRMNAIAPNLTVLVGELVGARLIAHAGSLINLAKQPGSTVQILGAEKALFRALKTKHATPKYGLIYNASLVGQAPPKLKGKISRSLAAKSALSVRYDALGDAQDATIGFECKAKLENRLRQLEGRALAKLSGSAKGKAKIEPYDSSRKQGASGLVTAAKTYNPAADVVGLATPKAEEAEGKQKKRKREGVTAEPRPEAEAGAEVEVGEPAAGKSAKRRKREEPVAEVKVEPAAVAEEEPKKKKKKKHQEQQLVEPKEEPQGPGEENMAAGESAKKKKKKSKAAEPVEDPIHAENAVASSKKKKSKTVEDPEVLAGTDDGSSSKKKKSKAVPAEDLVVTDDGDSAKKKKKKKKHLEESA
ncbi:hypothetical protein GOP47_0012433 [Adiantum capillus-veneris]|uniref:Nucleolar protein 58 n=1 Tax=Adiantum capillus-veneris TaxID=13818 RepID=A0A9D4URR3_ADICA|nr:hypothetical protein GOP47_0012433 [Adiantum capillus-veneris]